MKRWTCLATLLALAATPAYAQTVLTERNIQVAGNDDVNATAINTSGSITATVFDKTKGTQSGIVLHGKRVITLAPLYQGSSAPMPQSINQHGDVLGYAYEGIQPHLFLLHAGQYDANADADLVIEQQQGPPPLPVGLNRRDEVFYTIITGRSNPTDPIYGKFPHVHSMPRLMLYQTAHSLNASGLLAGTTFYGNASAVFVGHGRNFTQLLPPKATKSSGGYVNDAGEVAGTYTDSANTQHGFTYANGAYTSFDLPEAAQPYSASVTGLNNAGRVVGVYASLATGTQHAFLFNGTTVTPFGKYDRADFISVTLNDRGTILVSRQIQQAAADYRSYRVTCAGSGC